MKVKGEEQEKGNVFPLSLSLFARLAAAAAMATAAIVLAQRLGSDPHGAKDRCQACHFDPPPAGLVPPAGARSGPAGAKYALRYDRERAVCERCHAARDQRTHPIEVKGRASVPEGWPVDAQGRLMCSTCHDPHLPTGGSKRTPPMRHLLRGEAMGPAFCQQCHGSVAKGDSRAWHVVVTQSAHTAQPPQGDDSASGFDALTVRCLGCHDGTAGKDVGVRMGRTRLGVGRASSHPVGVRYRASAPAKSVDDRSPRLRPEAMLDKRIRLFSGKVGCGSCHNLYSQERKFLAIDTRNGRLCRSCHDM